MAGLIEGAAGIESQPQPSTAGLIAEKMPSLLDQARGEFPYLSDKDIAFTKSQSANDGRKLEYWPADEEGGGNYMRPRSLPLGKAGIEVFDDDVRPIDVLADYVSHEGVNKDPKLAELYQEFANRTEPAVLQERYAYHRENLGENRPFDVWAQQTGLPELFRGYTFNQWGEGAEKMYTPQQLEVLDATKKYLGIGK